MLLLAIDTAGPNCAAAVARSAAGAPEILARAEERIGRGHAERLMPLIGGALRDAGISFRELDRVAATVGPGSFTGVRIGIAAARGFALALEIPAFGIGSLDALAYPLARDHELGTAVAVLDARRDEVYARAEDLASGAVLREAAAIKPEPLAEELAAARRPLLFTGSGSPLLASYFSAAEMRIVTVAEFPDIADVAALAFLEDARRPPSPLYVRGADAKPQASAVALR